MVVLAVLPIFLRSTAQGFLHEVCSGRRHRSLLTIYDLMLLDRSLKVSGGEEVWETALVHVLGMSSLVTACNNTGTTCNDDSNSCGRIVYNVRVEACTKGIDKKIMLCGSLSDKRMLTQPIFGPSPSEKDALGKKSLHRSSVPVTGLPEASALAGDKPLQGIRPAASEALVAKSLAAQDSQISFRNPQPWSSLRRPTQLASMF